MTENGKPILMGGCQMGDGLRAGSDIEGARIGEEGFSFASFHPIHHSSQEEGPDKSRIASFAKMKFDRHQVLFSDLCLQVGAISKRSSFSRRVFPGPTFKSEKKTGLFIVDSPMPAF